MESGDRLRELLEEPLPEPHRRPGLAWLVAVGVAGLAALGVAVAASLQRDSPGTATAVTVAGTVAPATAQAAASPGPRVFAAMEYEPATGDVLLVGGQEARRGGLAGGAFRFDGEAWRLAADDPVLDRTGHAVAWVDSLGGTMLVGGGTSPLGRCPGGWCTRSLDGGTWLLAQGEAPRPLAAGPSRRFGHALAYDRAADRVVLFGGVAAPGASRSGEVLGDTWIYDPALDRWEEIATSTGPAPRSFHQMVTDPVTGRVLLWGGRAADPRESDATLWAFDAGRRAWGPVDADGPGPRWLHRMAADPVTGQVLLLGGEAIVERPTEAGTISEQTCIGEVWVLDPARPAWTEQEAVPGAICGHALAPDGTGRLLAVQGAEVGLYDPATQSWATRAPLS